jgi:hypothetical protein
MGYEMPCHTGSHLECRNCNLWTNEFVEAVPGNHSRDLMEGNIAHDGKSTAFLKSEWWGSPQVQGRSFRKSPFDKVRSGW